MKPPAGGRAPTAMEPNAPSGAFARRARSSWGGARQEPPSGSRAPPAMYRTAPSGALARRVCSIFGGAPQHIAGSHRLPGGPLPLWTQTRRRAPSPDASARYSAAPASILPDRAGFRAAPSSDGAKRAVGRPRPTRLLGLWWRPPAHSRVAPASRRPPPAMNPNAPSGALARRAGSRVGGARQILARKPPTAGPCPGIPWRRNTIRRRCGR